MDAAVEVDLFVLCAAVCVAVRVVAFGAAGIAASAVNHVITL